MSRQQENRIDDADIGMQVLLMEDDASVAKGLQMILTEEGYTVDVAMSGQSALDAASVKRFDLLVADLRLPDMDGMDVVKRCKGERPKLEVIVITGYANIHTAVDAMKTGAIDYLPKPFTEDAFMARVRGVMEKRKKERKEDTSAQKPDMPEITDGKPKLKVLVVEDEPSVAKGLMMILEEQGFAAEKSDNGQAAVDMIADSDFDLLVIDLRLPDMDGMDIVRHAGTRLPAVPVIVITGYSSVPSAVEALRSGVSDYLEKPFTEEVFIDTVGKAIRQSREAERFVQKAAQAAAGVRTGFYICHGGAEISNSISIDEIVAFAKKQPGVVVARDHQYLCRDSGLALIQKDIAQQGLNRVVVAACAPAAYEKIFSDACVEAGLKQDHFQMLPVREQVSWVAKSSSEGLTKSRALVAAAIHRVTYHQIHPPRRVPVNSDVLVVGGGIAGMQASLDIARSGNRVYLVEKSSTIGGHMLQFDKTFPTLDCAACIGTPVMVEVAQQPNIDLMTCSEVIEITGHIGNYVVKVLQKPRYVNQDACTGCGECEKVCPITRPSEWDVGLKQRGAIYRSFPQAVPIAYAIDKRGTAPCKVACPSHVSVQGYIALINRGKYSEALRLYRQDNPFPGVCGRVCHHPCESDCTRKDHDQPLAIRDLHRFLFDWETSQNEIFLPAFASEKRAEKIAVIGSGPAGLATAYFLAAKGYRATVYEKLPVTGGWMVLGIPEYRLPRDVLIREIDIIKSLGVEIKTGVTFGKEITLETLSADGYAAVFMGIGLPAGRRIGIENEHAAGVIQGLDFLRNTTLGIGVPRGEKAVVIGGGNVAFDCARTLVRMGTDVTIMYRRSRGDMPAHEEEIVEAGKEGIKFIYLAAPEKIHMDDKENVTGIEYLRMAPGDPDESGRPVSHPIKGSEIVLETDLVILAIGQKIDTAEIEGGNISMTPYGRIDADPVTLQTSMKWVFAGGDAVYGPKSVVEAVSCGKTAAESIDRFIQKMDLHEGREKNLDSARSQTPPGVLHGRVSPHVLAPEERTGNFCEVVGGISEAQAMMEAARCMECGICSECYECVKVCQPKAIDHEMKPECREFKVGSIILATGFDLMDPQGLKAYGYGRYPNVFTSLEFERLNNATGPTGGQILMRDPNGGFEGIPKSVALIHCVGSRDVQNHEYCSRVCCMYALKYSHLIREKVGPDAQVYEFYIDMRCYGKGYEEFYRRCQEEGVNFIRSKPAEIAFKNGRLMVVGEDTLLNRMYRIPVDMVILCTAIEPRSDAGEVARISGISQGTDGFFNEHQNKIAPLTTEVGGIFLAGNCQAPKDIADTVAQASGAAGRALEISMRGSVEIPYTIAWIDPEVCNGCRTCISQCEYEAIAFDELRGVAMVNPAVCKGCGVCISACDTSAAHIWQFRENRILTEFDDLGAGLQQAAEA